VTVDYFDITGRRHDALPRVLRLSGRFLSSDPVELLLTNTQDLGIDAYVEVDHDLGVIYADLAPGRYKVTYTQGFAVDEDNVFLDVPDWLKSIAKAALELQYRTTTNINIPDNVSYGDLVQAVKDEMYAMVTKRAEKPRVGCWFPQRSVNSVPPEPVLPVDPEG
jgi:hypothetical protein